MSETFLRKLISALALSGVLVLLAPGMAEASDDENSPFSSEEMSYWAFQPVIRPTLPQAISKEAVIDTLIDVKLREHDLVRSPPAQKVELIRRATFDLWGLPPTSAQVAEFVNDTMPGAYERLIDRLLASPRYGERWGRYWLDVVRFSESAGFNADPLRPLAYKYRDYVIQAFNADMPYDQFVQQQLAGDELFPESSEALIATGFNRLWPDESNASNVELARQTMLNDMTGTVGSVFLGMSLGCAECHDHKFDPILQKDFYRLQAFFAPMIPVDRVAVGSEKELAEYEKQLAQWQSESQAVREELWELELSARAQVTHIKRLKFPAVVLEAIDTPAVRRTAQQHQLAFWSERQIEFKDKQLLEKMDETQQQRLNELREKWKELLAAKPKPPIDLQAMVSTDGTAPPATSQLAGGSYNKPVEQVQPGFPSILHASHEGQPAEIVPPRPGTSGRRTALARWITDPANPLTARVMVNRIWQGHFGRGIVDNANDLGTQTRSPSHPKLLDWLADEFIAGGWSIKAMHRLIMTSAVYRQSTRAETSEGNNVDSENRWYWHFPRRRLDAESIRDAMLAVSGELNFKMYGPGVKPQLPPNFSVREGWKPTEDLAERNRRSVYILAKRNLPYPLMQVFDFPDTHKSCARRQETTIAPQALTLLNSDLVLGFGGRFATRLISAQAEFELQNLIKRAYVDAFGRPATEEEIRGALQFIKQQQALIAQRIAQGKAVLLPPEIPLVISPSLAAAIVDFCHALLNANEFVYID